MTIDPLYPIIDNPDWIGRLGRAGARLIQLRMKDRPEAELRVAIRAAVAMAKPAGITLVVNDHWRIALDEGARWVHLGQEDLDGADLAALRARGIRLGVSTHDGQELARALAVRPDYIALGPIFPTTVKALRFAPQGVDRIGEWKAAIAAALPEGQCPPPLVAIGGITLETARACLDAGADSIAIISDIVKARDPDARCRALVAVTRRKAPAATA
ncbi:MAG: thiamine phosphate synthase [Beijerinckiaceae bacterium]|nr:thiamine phosphate synthase [Beijerinckiaceae bacterium]